MYKNLKFSWAHILAFIALIAIGVLVYLGSEPYYGSGRVNGGAVLWAVVSVLLLLATFVGAQQLKGVDNDFSFKKCIWWERILFFAAPVVLLFVMVRVNHTLNVVRHIGANGQTVVNEALGTYESLFSGYDTYVDDRVAKYDDYLHKVQRNKYVDSDTYDKVRFRGQKVDEESIEIEKNILRMLITANYDNFKERATVWANDYKKTTNYGTVSAWNPFILVNVYKLKNALTSCDKSLQNLSSKKLETEGKTVECFNESARVNSAAEKLDKLVTVDHDSFLLSSIVYFIVFYIMLRLPYWVQDRNGVSTYTLFGRRFLDPSVALDDSDDSEDSDLSSDGSVSDVDLGAAGDSEPDCSDEEEEDEARRERMRQRRAKWSNQ